MIALEAFEAGVWRWQQHSEAVLAVSRSGTFEAVFQLLAETS